MYIQTIPNISYVDMSIPKNSKSSPVPRASSDSACSACKCWRCWMSGPKGVHTSRIFRAEAHLSEACLQQYVQKSLHQQHSQARQQLMLNTHPPKRSFVLGCIGSVHVYIFILGGLTRRYLNNRWVGLSRFVQRNLRSACSCVSKQTTRSLRVCLGLTIPWQGQQPGVPRGPRSCEPGDLWKRKSADFDVFHHLVMKWLLFNLFILIPSQELEGCKSQHLTTDQTRETATFKAGSSLEPQPQNGFLRPRTSPVAWHPYAAQPVAAWTYPQISHQAACTEAPKEIRTEQTFNPEHLHCVEIVWIKWPSLIHHDSSAGPLTILTILTIHPHHPRLLQLLQPLQVWRVHHGHVPFRSFSSFHERHGDD